MTELEKLRVMLPHWIEHNRSHVKEFKKWAEIIGNEGEAEIAAFIEKAISGLTEADQVLTQALEKAGGPSGDADADHHLH